MITAPLIAEIAALVGEPARATMLSALLDGRALTASELAFAARVTPQTASMHLAKLAEAAEITRAGTRFLTEFGIDLSALSSKRRPFCRLCIDWTERRPHLAGAVGAALTKRCFDPGWTERMKHSSAVIVTASGKHGFRETFGIVADGSLPPHQLTMRMESMLYVDTRS